MAWSPDGQRLTSSDGDGTIILWDLAKAEPAKTLTGHDGPVICIAWSPDGKSLASGGADREVRVWPVPPVEKP